VERSDSMFGSCRKLPDGAQPTSPEQCLMAQALTGDVSACAGWVRGHGEAGRKVRCSMQAHDWMHEFPQFKLQGTLKFMLNDAMTMGACSEDASLHV